VKVDPLVTVEQVVTVIFPVPLTSAGSGTIIRLLLIKVTGVAEIPFTVTLVPPETKLDPSMIIVLALSEQTLVGKKLVIVGSGHKVLTDNDEPGVLLQ
jgi:hypothetical protein